MLSNSFLHIPGVGPVTESRIWKRGVLTWDQFLADPAAADLSARMAARVTDAIALSRDHLQRDDHRFFAASLPTREHWRAYPEFSHRIGYLDIETTGLEGPDYVTMIGLYDGRDVRTYTRGENLDQFFEDIGRFGLLVTFFGSAFDLPFLRRRYPKLVFDQIHIDLCYTLRRLGLKGGLKHIEHQLDVPRAPETEGLDGWDAVRLWREWEAGSQEALDLLKAYNREDIVSLERLMHYAYDHLRSKTGLPPPVS
ncbi:MAG: ribonuclease H-like domain-containing protein [Armatimonadota bacterium]|nr:MAG: ribonuclease H-like domain-containing protein [Armatimonadota bacterium]